MVRNSAIPAMAKKVGVEGITDAGNVIIASASLERNAKSVSSYGGGSKMTFPRWVRVTWREGVARGQYWTTGTVVGDHTVKVLERIPADVFSYVNAKAGRAIVLHFRIKDDCVLLAWDVRDSTANGIEWVYLMHGGDFLDPKRFNGKIIDPGWEVEGGCKNSAK